MGSCCHAKEKDLESTAQKHRKVLWIVLALNLMMFFVEFTFGLIGNSLSLMGDSLDMLGDAATYGSSLAVVGMGLAQKVKVARFKAWIMLIFGLILSGRCIYSALYPAVPHLGMMFSVGLWALAVNLICLFLLSRHRDDDINMKSVWICSRNDIIANVSILLAAGIVYFTGSGIADIAVGVGLTYLFVKSAFEIFADAKKAT